MLREDSNHSSLDGYINGLGGYQSDVYQFYNPN